jgi:hypothetical protein
MEMEVEVTDEQKHASYINLIETIACLSRGDELSDEWIESQVQHIRLIRRYYTDMGLVNLERQDTEFRTIASELETALTILITEMDLFGTLNKETYLEFCKGALRLMDMLEEDDALINAFSNLLG